MFLVLRNFSICGLLLTLHCKTTTTSYFFESIKLASFFCINFSLKDVKIFIRPFKERLLVSTSEIYKLLTSSFELNPSGRQIDLSIGYRTKVSKIYNIGITMSASKDYQHVKSEEIINSASAYIKFDF